MRDAIKRLVNLAGQFKGQAETLDRNVNSMKDIVKDLPDVKGASEAKDLFNHYMGRLDKAKKTGNLKAVAERVRDELQEKQKNHMKENKTKSKDAN